MKIRKANPGLAVRALVILSLVTLISDPAPGAAIYGTQDLFVYEEISTPTQDLTPLVVSHAGGATGRSISLPGGAEFIESFAFSGRIEDTALAPLPLMSVGYGIYREGGVDKFAIMVSPDVGTSQEAYLGPLDLIATDMTPIFDTAGVGVGQEVTTRAKLAASVAPEDFSVEAGLDELEVFALRANDSGLIGFGDPDTGHAWELIHEGLVTEGFERRGGSKVLRDVGKGLLGLGVFAGTGDGLWGGVAALATFDGLLALNMADEIDRRKEQRKRDEADYHEVDYGHHLRMSSSDPRNPRFGAVPTYPMDPLQRYDYFIRRNEVMVVPEPASLALLAIGGWSIRRRASRGLGGSES